MLGSIFHKRKKPQDLRTPSLQDIKRCAESYIFCADNVHLTQECLWMTQLSRFRDTYARHAERRCVEPPACLERSVYKAISSQRELHSLDFRQEDITDPQLIALAETLMELPLISSLDLRDNRITDDGAKALLEVMRLQIIAAKTPVPCDAKKKRPLFPQIPEYTKYVTSVNLRGNEISAEVQQELAQYMTILRREDKRLEIRAALAQMDRDSRGGIDEDEFKGVLRLLTGAEPSKRDLRAMMQQHSLVNDNAQGELSLENVLLARCSSPTSNKVASPPWEALVQVRHSNVGASSSPAAKTVDIVSEDTVRSARDTRLGGSPDMPMPPSSAQVRMPSPVSSARLNEHFESEAQEQDDFNVAPMTPQHSLLNVRLDETPATTPPSTPTAKLVSSTFSSPNPGIPPLVFAPPSPGKRHGNSPRSSSITTEDYAASSLGRRSLAKQLSFGNSRGSLQSDRMLTPSASSTSSPHQSEPLDSPRSSASAQLTPSTAKRTFPNDSEKSSGPALAKKAPTIQDSLRFDTTDDTEGFGDPDSAEPFVIDSSTDDILLSVLSQTPISDNRKSEPVANSPSQLNSAVPRSILEMQGFMSAERSLSGDTSVSVEYVGYHEGTEANTSRDEELVKLQGDEESDWKDTEVSHDTAAWSGEKESDTDYATTDQVTSFVADPATTVVDTKSEASDEEEEECVDVVDAEVVKDGKSRTVMRLVHTALKSGLKLTELPCELPFRNLLVLILSGNKLRDLTLFQECRFPFIIALDLSHNRLSKVQDKALAMFPKLQILDMSHNQLKAISGVLDSFKLRALNVSHNCIRSVTNIEHLVALEILTLSANNISAAHSLRLLSLNKMLSRIDLDGNPIVDTDERQRRKNIVYILNLVPSLTSLGSIACASLQSKEKKKKTANGAVGGGASLFDVNYFPEMETAWMKRACDSLACFQDKPIESSGVRDEDDEDGEGNQGEMFNSMKKSLNRTQQRQKDDMRSRALAYRSREKAPPSPPKAKTSIYSFGEPLSPPVPRKSKKATDVAIDPAAARRQSRRSSELSTPKHPPVDTELLKKEQLRKSRPAFDPNMSVAERLLLAQEQAHRRSSNTFAKRSNSSKRQVKRELTAIATIQDADSNPQETKQSLLNLSPTKAIVAFRIEPLNSIRRQDVLEFRIEPSRPTSTSDQLSNTKSHIKEKANSLPSPRGSVGSVPPTKEDEFLRSLAVGDFLTHTAEELSTSLTALNVLLSMCEKELSDRNKLNDYRASLEALGILDEQESHTLYERTKAFGGHDHETQCVEAFERLGLVKRCLRQLLEKLHQHEPGSGVIRALCRSMRSVELRSVLSDCSEPELRSKECDVHQNPANQGDDLLEVDTVVSQPQPSLTSVNSRLFGLSSLESSDYAPPSVSQETVLASSVTVENSASLGSNSCNDVHDGHEANDDIDLDFLQPTASTFDTYDPTSLFDMSGDSEQEALRDDSAAIAASILESSSTDLADSATSSSYPAGFDITFDIQMESNTSEFDTDCVANSNEAGLQTGGELVEQSGEGFSGSLPTLLAEEDSFGDAGANDEWLGGGTTIDAVDTDALGSALEGENSGLKWDETEVYPDLTSELGNTAAEDCGNSGAGFEENETSFDQVQSESGTFDQVDDVVVESGYREQADEFDSGESPAAYHEDDANDGAELEALDAEIDSAYEPEPVFEETETELTHETEATKQEMETGEDADDEEAEMFGDWEKGFDPNSNHYFWFNHATGESSWEPPEGWPYEVDEPFEGGSELVTEDGETLEQTEGVTDEPGYSRVSDNVELGNGEDAATQGGEEAESHDDSVSRASDIEASRASEVDFDDNDLPSF